MNQPLSSEASGVIASPSNRGRVYKGVENVKRFGDQARRVKKQSTKALMTIVHSRKGPVISGPERRCLQLSAPKMSGFTSKPVYHSLELPNTVISIPCRVALRRERTTLSMLGAGVSNHSLVQEKTIQDRPQQISDKIRGDQCDRFNVINEYLEWSEVSEMSMGEKTVGDCFFAYAEPTKELLPANTLLYKFSNYPSLPDKRHVSPWWSSVLERKDDSGLKNRLLLAQHLKVNPLEWGRVTSVIKENWSSLEYVIFIKTTNPMYGWMGGFSAFKRVDTGSKSKRDALCEPKGSSYYLPGGARQLFIPNLQKEQISLISVKKTLEIQPEESIFDDNE